MGQNRGNFVARRDASDQSEMRQICEQGAWGRQDFVGRE
jgi:hypothetical protein